VVGFGATDLPEGPDPLLFTGIHVIAPQVLRSIPSGQACDTIRDTYPPWIEAGQVAAHVDDRRWWELSTLERYLELHRAAHREGLAPEVTLGEGASVEDGAEVRSSVLWEGARVPKDASLVDVVLGAQVELPAGSRLARTVVVRRERAGEVERGAVRGDLLYVPVDPGGLP
jgi:NDP-sugar pyrophosphorylase family protein